jgi:hypothetical protein
MEEAMMRTALPRSSGKFRPSWRLLASAATLGISLGIGAGLGTLVAPTAAHADEGGVSFWIPGLFGSFAASPLQAGWAMTAIDYYTNVSGGGQVAAEREITIGKLSPTVAISLNANVHANAELALVEPNYTFDTKVFGGQLNVGMLAAAGRSSAALAGTITAGVGPFTASKSGQLTDVTDGFSDLIPLASLRWNSGVNNFMIYGTGDIPVGTYNSSQLANIGIGHGVVDGGVSYTFLDPKIGQEFSVTNGFTYNLVNPSTGYQNGIDWHLDWGLSQFVSKEAFFGAVGYVYNQLTADRGSLPIISPVESRVVGVGPQIGFIIPVGGVQTYLNLKAYGEWDGHDRPSGFNTWAVLSLSPSPQTPTSSSAAMKAMLGK